jgi:hypothetical protein
MSVLPAPRYNSAAVKPAFSILAGACCVLALVACGGSGARSGSAASNPQLKMSECMRAHGVPGFPDPVKGSGGEGLSVSVSATGGGRTTIGGIPFSGPVFEAAIKSCKFFGGGGAPSAVSESQKIQLFHFAACMRAHGVTNYPDPVFPSGGGIERPSAPGLDLNAPAVQRAVKLCNRS